MVETVEKLYDMRETFDLVLGNVNDLICIVDPKENYKIEMVNQKIFQEILGYSRNELIGRSFLELMFQGNDSKPISMIENALYNKEQPKEIKIKKKDGNFIWVEIKGKKTKTINAQERLLLILKDITQIEIKDKDFNNAAARFELISSYSDDFYAILNDNFEYEYINDRVYKESLGFEKEEIVGKTALNMIYPDDVKKAVRGLRKGFDTGENSTDIRVRTKNGDYVWVETKGRIFTDDDGNKKALLTGRDITARKEAEQKLYESEEKYRGLINNLIDIILELDLKGTVTFISPQCIDIIGYQPNELIGKSAFEFIHSDDVSIIAESMKKAYQTKNTISVLKYRLLHKNGNVIYASERGRMVNINGNDKFIGAIRDISAQVVTEQKLKESEEKYRVLFDKSPVGITISNSYNKLILMNDKIEEITGYSKEELNEIKIESIYFDDNQYKEIFEIMGVRGVIRDYEVKIKQKEGSERICLLNVDKHKISGASVFQTTLQDITGSKEAEQKLKESEERLSAFKEAAPMSFALFDSELNIVDVNQNTLSRLPPGTKREDVIGKHLTEYAPNAKETGRYDKYVEVMKTGNPFYSDDVTVHPQYGNISLELRAFKVGDGMGFITIDNTERKLIEQQLKESEEKFRTIANQSMMGISIFQDGLIKYANQQLASIYGGSIDDLFKLKPGEFLKYIDPDYRDLVIEQLRKKESGHENGTSRYRMKVITQKGEIHSIENHSKSITFDGRPAILGMQIDITDKVRMEQSLQESEEKFRTIADQSMMGICIVQDNRVKYLNKIFPEIWGYTVEEMINWTIEDIQKAIYPEDREFIINQLRKKQEGQSDIELNYKYRGIKKNGEVIWIENFSKTIIYQGKPADLVTIIDITERKKAETRLEESEQTFREREKSLIDIIIEMDMNGNVMYTSPQVFDILGYKEEELIGTNGYDIAFPDDVPQIQERTMESYEQNKPIYFEFRAKHKDGHYIPMSARGNIVIADNTPKIVGIMKDDSEKIEAETKLKQSEEKYRNLFDSSPNAIILMDRNGKIQDCNLTTETMLGYKKEDLIGENYLELQAFSPTVRPKERIKVMDANKQIHNPVEILVKRKDGNPAWITAQTSNIKIGDKKLFQIIIQDITEKRKYEELISELNMNFLTFTADIQSNIHLLLNTCCSLLNGELALYVNKTKRDEIEQYEVMTSDKRMFTYNAGDFEKLIHVSEFFREEHDYSQVLQNVNDTKYAETDHFIQDHSIKSSYGKLIKIETEYDGLLCVLYQENPTISHQDDLVMFLICDAIEIEQRRWKAKEKLEAQNEALSEISRLKSDLLSRTSHELKTPLISIKGFTELLMTRHGNKLDSDMVSILDEIKDGSKRLERIIHSLLQSSKLEQGKVVLSSSQEDLSFLINFCVKEVDSLAVLREQTIFIDVKDKILANFDKERLYDVLINLLSNAIKNTPPKGEITIFTKVKNDSVVVSVKDSGVGITEEEKNKLFKKFGKIERYGQSWDINIEGTGLGLYIAKKIVRLHGGNIWVESEGRNKGSTFSFSIPKT